MRTVVALIALAGCPPQMDLCGADVVGGGRVDVTITPTGDPAAAWAASRDGATLAEVRAMATSDSPYDAWGNVENPLHGVITTRPQPFELVTFRVDGEGSPFPHGDDASLEVFAEVDLATRTAPWVVYLEFDQYEAASGLVRSDGATVAAGSGTLETESVVAGSGAWTIEPVAGHPVAMTIAWNLDPEVHVDGTKLCPL